MSGQTFEVVHDFDGTDGSSPSSALIEADGSLFGTTAIGGAHNLGTIYRRESDGTVTALHHFDGATDGSLPRGALLRGQDGDFYGVAARGGAFDFGTVYRMTPGGFFTVLHDLPAPEEVPILDNPEGFLKFSAPLIQVEDGRFYGVTFDGGNSTCDVSVVGCGTVFQMDSLGNTLTVLHTFAETDGANPTSIMQADDGDLWGTTNRGGAGNCGTIFRMTLAGAFTHVHDFAGTDGCNPWGSLLQASDGNLYGTVRNGGSGGGGIFRVTPAGAVSLIAPFDPALLRCSDAALIEASDGDLYGTAQSSLTGLGSVFRATFAGGATVIHGFSGSDGSSPSAGLVEPEDGLLYGTAAGGGANGDGVIFRIELSSGPLFCPNSFVRRDQMAVFLLKTIHGTAYTPPACSGDFADVACPSLFADWIEALADEGITAGCGGNDFCPLAAVRRDQMAVFLLKAEHGSTFTPPACQGDFPDVPCPSLFADWVEALADGGITAGCGGGFFCPAGAVTRAQMAVFLLKIEHGSAYVPPACQAVFADVLCPSQFADWIEQLYAEGITAGCGGGSP